MGGFRRRATFIAQQRLAEKNLLVLDTGDALLGGGALGEKTRGKAIVDGMNQMGYDAMALGPNELSLGLDQLRARISEARFPMLSANVVLTGTKGLLARPYVILEVGGRRFGIIGLTRPPLAPAPGLQVTDPQAAAVRYVPEVAAQAGTVVVLTNLDINAAQALAQAVPDIDLVIAALPSVLLNQAVRVPGTGALVVVADLPFRGESGRRVGVLTVSVQPDGTLAGESWQTQSMGKTIPDDPTMAALLSKY